MPTDSGIGSATVHPDDAEIPAIEILVNGPCVERTLSHLEEIGQLTRQMLEKIRSQAVSLLEDVVGAYEGRVAHGEVGAGGTMRASSAPPISGAAPTGLLYGRVQSGKTAAMQIASAMAFDNGFRVIVVLTSNNIKLVQQTFDRFDELRGPLIYSSLGGGPDSYSWDQQEGHIRNWAPRRGVVFVCAKEDGHLESLINLLQRIGAQDWPALIMDDEADHATPDTNQAKRAGGKPATGYSTTFRLVVENDQKQGFSLRESMPHNVFLQITATPYALLLQSLTNPLKPAFTRLLIPGEGYTGGEFYFAGAKDVADVPLVYVDEGEAVQLETHRTDAPKGLREAIAFFVLASAAHRLIHVSAPLGGYTFLCHTSARQAKHRALAKLIDGYVQELAELVCSAPQVALEREEVQAALRELAKTVEQAPSPLEIIEEAGLHLPTRKLLIVNAAEASPLPVGGHLNFIVGGNILGRGLTIKNLLVTYYLRQAKVSQMDTMHQHARMYGYRKQLSSFARVYLPKSLALRFRRIHESEESLRNLLTGSGKVLSIPVEVAGDVRATRSNVLDVGAISAYRPGQQVYPVEPLHDKRLLGASVKMVSARVKEKIGDPYQVSHYYPVAIDDIIDIVKLVRVGDGEGEWNTNAIVNVLVTLRDRHKDKYHSKGYLFIRTFKRSSTILATGGLSGAEQKKAKSLNAPVLFLLYGKKGQPWDSDIVYPEIVFPGNMPAMIFNWDAGLQGGSNVA